MIDEQKLREVAGAAVSGDDIAYDILCEDLGSGVVILALLDELATLRSERTAWRVTAENAEKDAARYRWLRDQQWQENRIGVVIRPKDQTKLGSFLPSGSLLDDAIDHMSTTDLAIDVTEETP